MDLRHLRYAVAIADHGSATAAAAALHVAQPSLSQTVRALEAELGTPLFQRTPRGMRPTAAGEAFLAPARRALRDADAAAWAVAEVIGLEGGHLTVATLPTLAVHPTAALVGRFLAEHPAVQVRVREAADPDTAIEQLRRGLCDLAITEPAADSPDVVTLSLPSQEYVAVLPEGRRGGPAAASLTLAELARHPIVTTPPGTSTRRVLDDALGAAGLRAAIAVETDHREAIEPLVAAGAGVAVLPREVASTRGGTRVVPLRPRLRRHLAICHPAGPLAPAARQFVELATGRRPPGGRPRPRRRAPRPAPPPDPLG